MIRSEDDSCSHIILTELLLQAPPPSIGSVVVKCNSLISIPSFGTPQAACQKGHAHPEPLEIWGCLIEEEIQACGYSPGSRECRPPP